MFIHFSSLSSFVDDGCHKWFEERGMQTSLLGSLANDRGMINEVLDGKIKCCRNFIWDSGAISVRNKKTEITLETYVGWVREIHKTEVPLTIVGLDVIGDPIASQRNYLRLKYDYGFGNAFMPAFHYGEDFSYLETLVEEGFDYIGLGGVGAGDRLGQEQLRDWVKTVMFVNGDGRTLRYPHVRWHGFAQTSKVTMNMFPYYSVDSAAWVKNSALGKILTPWGDWRASDDPRTGVDGQHIYRAGQKTLDRITNWINDFGFTLEQVVNGRFEKHIVNINYFLELEKNHAWKPSNVESGNIYSLIQHLGISPIKKENPKLDLNLFSIKTTELPLVKELPYIPGCVDFTVDEELIIKEVEPTMQKERSSPLDTLKSLQADLSKVPTPIAPVVQEIPKLNLTPLVLPQIEQKPLESISQSEKISQPKPHEPTAYVNSKFVSSVISMTTCPHCLKSIVFEVETKASKLIGD